MYFGTDNIMQAFDTLRPDGVPFYSLWLGTMLIYQYNGNDEVKGREILEQTLMQAESQGNANTYSIKFHSQLDGGYITNRTKNIGCLLVCAVDNTEDGEIVSGVTRPGDVPRSVYNMMKRIDEGMSATMEARLKALEDNKPEREPDMLDRISGILEKPEIANGLVQLLQPIIQRLTGAPAPNIQVAGTNRSHIAESSDMYRQRNDQPSHNNAVSAAAPHIAQNSDVGQIEERDLTDEENALIDGALNRLGEHCDIVKVLPLLADWAAANTNMFKMLLQQLEASK